MTVRNRTTADTAPCPYETHRPSDHIAGDGTGPLVCGVCHPPTYDGAVRRGAPRFDDLVAAAVAREVPGPPRCTVCKARTQSGEPGLCTKCEMASDREAADAS